MKKKLIIIIGILILLALSFILIIGNKSDSNTAKNTNIGKDDIAKIDDDQKEVNEEGTISNDNGIWKEAATVLINKSSLDDKYTGYSLFDIDKDGIIEVILYSGSIEAEKEIIINKYMDDLYDEIGNISGSHTILWNNNGKLVSQNTHQGYETDKEISIKNNKIVEKEIYSSKDIEKDYKEYGKQIEIYKINDVNNIKNYK